MGSCNYDVLVVGAGAAGLTAAIGLARAGFAVAAVEAAPFPGAENWSGCVYFCENLAHPDILGPDGVQALAWERRLVERGFFASDGQGLLGMTYRDPEAFRHCYTVLRPVYDHHLAQVALRHGVALLSGTTAESLIRDGERVVGVCTQRGPLYADLVFLAEGDASHLVTREGYERYPDQRDAPRFLQGIKEVIELPPGAIERTFGVGREEGVAYELLLRNGSLRGRSVHLNMGGFVYTNRQSLSIGLVLPADNLREHFDGAPNLLMQWFENLPALRPWLQNGKRGTFGAKLIRGGGARDIPHLIDHGLAIGGAASAIGIDFPYPNFTGPATAMGLLLCQAVRRIRAEGGDFSRDNLRRHYLEPLRQTHYWQDVEFLRRWPGYVKRTRVFFDRNLDLALGTAYVWTRTDRWFVTKWANWLRLILHVAGPGRWRESLKDIRQLARALRLREVTARPRLGQVLLDGSLNALRDLFGRPRAQLPAAGTLRLHYTVADGAEASGRPPAVLRRWFRRFAPVLAPAARRVYTNDDRPLADRLPGALGLLTRQINLIDLVAAGAIGLAAAASGALLVGWDRFLGWFRRRPGQPPRGLYPRYALAARQAADLTPAGAPAAQQWEARLAALAYQTVKASHIHVLWPKALAEKNQVTQDGLWHVCPAHVYEARVSPLGQLQVVVNFENCIKCETCWRTSDLADWGRDGQHRFIYPVHTPVVTRLLDAVGAAGLARPRAPRALDWWEDAVRLLAEQLPAGHPEVADGEGAAELAEIGRLLDQLERKLEEFDAALAKEPRTIDRARAEYLEMLARYAQQLAVRVVEVLRGSVLADSPHGAVVAVYARLVELATALAAKTEERARRTWNQRFAWAASAGRQLRYHHLAGLRRFLHLLERHPSTGTNPSHVWLRAEEDGAALAPVLAEWRARLDRVFAPSAWRDLEHRVPLTTEQDAVLRDLVARVPVIDQADLAGTLHPPLRKALLAELGRRDPSLAYRVASHLWARDLARLATVSASIAETAQRWTRGEEWACFALVEAARATQTGWVGEALFVPAQAARAVLLLVGDRLAIVPADRAEQMPGLQIDKLATLGLRGAGLARVRLDGPNLPPAQAAVDRDRIRRVWHALSAADLTSIAVGIADELCRRAIGHATSRVQFPGLFHDEDARDTIGKFGAVKNMVAAMAARRYLIETLDHTLSPTDFSSASVERAGLVKAVVAEALGTAPGSLSYNAGQVFGGTGFSEDDILSKFYRDASAWRFLGPLNTELFRHHGDHLLRGWRSDGHRVSTLRDEAQLFEQVAQRKALQAELDEVRVARSHLRGFVNEWQAAQKRGADVGEALARQDAHLLASKALLLRTHARLEHGLGAETETALLRVWLEDATVALQEFEAVARRRLAPPEQPEERPIVEPSAGPPVTAYADYLAAPCPYDSGDFLTASVDLRQPRFVPEMIAADPVLAERDRRFRTLFAEYFGRPRADGLAYERHVEKQHRPDPEDLDFCRLHGFFRMPIQESLGGEGRPKVDYYLLTSNAQRLADVAISLTIQVNTSIGTTPILLAGDKDLPRAEKDLSAFRDNQALQGEVSRRLEEIQALLALPHPKRVEQAYQTLHKRLEETVFARIVLKVLAHRFLEAWQDAGRAGQRFDLTAMHALTGEALESWKQACGRAGELQIELARRREACDLFLRWIASGQISAFALTEPSAGSDTARVATRAHLRSVAVDVEPDGVLRFVPVGGKEPRYLLDARRLEFRSSDAAGEREYRAYYRWSGTAEPAPIHFEEYDYETDAAGRTRYYDHGNRRVPFTDIAQLRERDGGLWYDYWELTGAKMWITNGRMAGVFCLYAKTAEGVTGFLVDRHAEGLIVGKDEEKMGQCGSPTNELALQAVRVPRENVLGLEGRGQVNALETLNVGRAGLGMSGMAQMAGLIEQSRAFARATHGDVPDWVACRLQQMEEHRFTAEALAYEVIGIFEHPQTKSVRLESAIAKMLVSELLHRVIELAEEIHGLPGQTQLHLVEKRKRDARVLNIYEGTNEIQRFFILKDLAAEVAPRWSRSAATPQHLGREALELEALKAAARQRIEAALGLFGQELWQNPNLQANCFLLAEVAAWLKAVDSTLGRLAWLERVASDQGPVACEDTGEGGGGEVASDAGDAAAPSRATTLGRRALARCGTEVQARLWRFDEELARLRRGYYAPEIRAATLLFDRAAQAVPTVRLRSHISRPLSILVVVEASAAAVPQPYVVDGRLLEPFWSLSDADRSALEVALRLRDEAAAPVTVQVAAVGPRGVGQVLREVLSLGVERARLVVSEPEAVTPASAATALAAVLKTGPGFDLILGGGRGPEEEEGLVARLTAGLLGWPFAGNAVQLSVQATQTEAEVRLADGDGRLVMTAALPAALTVEAGLPLRPFTTAGYLAGLARTVEVERWPRRVAPQAVSFVREWLPDGGAATEEAPRPLTPQEAAGRVLRELGRDTGAAAVRDRYEGPIEDVVAPPSRNYGVWAVLAADAEGRLLPTARATLRAAEILADWQGTEAAVWFFAPEREEVQRRALGQLLESFRGTVVLLALADAGFSGEGTGRVLEEAFSALPPAARVLVGERWTEPSFASLGCRSGHADGVALRVRRLAVDGEQAVIETGRAGGRLRVRRTLGADRDGTWWISLTADAEVEGTRPASSDQATRIQRCRPRPERFHAQGEMRRLLGEVKQEIGVTRLADAEFIIDVGFGVGNRDGYEAVIEPLERALRGLGVRQLAVGGSRKVTEELHLLSADRQIGQSGVSVNPRVLLAIGISGAPQHLNYIGGRATVLAFNRDPEAPLLTLNQRQPRPRVFPIVGDLFETVPAFVAALNQEQAGPTERDPAEAHDLAVPSGARDRGANVE
jgi:alkylation response protein AidB-like acyl-CoA dehydrogenase/flavin-dependent dehydrogenase/ferredoxin-like protein FixX